jgi:hypothetical protein
VAKHPLKLQLCCNGTDMLAHLYALLKDDYDFFNLPDSTVFDSSMKLSRVLERIESGDLEFVVRS